MRSKNVRKYSLIPCGEVSDNILAHTNLCVTHLKWLIFHGSSLPTKGKKLDFRLCRSAACSLERLLAGCSQAGRRFHPTESDIRWYRLKVFEQDEVSIGLQEHLSFASSDFKSRTHKSAVKKVA